MNDKNDDTPALLIVHSANRAFVADSTRLPAAFFPSVPRPVGLTTHFDNSHIQSNTRCGHRTQQQQQQPNGIIMNKSCARCSKVVYPIEELKCLDKVRVSRAFFYWYQCVCVCVFIFQSNNLWCASVVRVAQHLAPVGHHASARSWIRGEAHGSCRERKSRGVRERERASERSVGACVPSAQKLHCHTAEYMRVRACVRAHTTY